MSAAKDRVVTVSTRIFATEGVNGASMRQLAKALDIQAPSLYSHFPSKADLVSACTMSYIEAVHTLVFHTTPPTLREVLSSYAEILDEHRYASWIVHKDMTQASSAKVVRQMLVSLMVDRGLRPVVAIPALLAAFREPWMEGFDPITVEVWMAVLNMVASHEEVALV